MHALLFALFAPFAGDLPPVPTGPALAAAEADVREVFGNRLRAADTDRERVELARRLIETAGGSRPAARYALLERARDLAIEAGDAAVGVAAVEGLVRGFAPQTPRDAASWASEGHHLWNLAGHKRPADRLRTQLEAAECYLRALPDLTSLNRTAAEGRLRELGWKLPLSPAEVMKQFPLAGWQADGEVLTGRFARVFDEDGRALSAAMPRIRSASLCVEILAARDVAVRADVDGTTHFAVFGAVNNTELLWRSGEKGGTRPLALGNPQNWHRVGASLEDGRLQFSLDGKPQVELSVPDSTGNGHMLRVGFGHHIGTAKVRRVRLAITQSEAE